MRQKLLFNGGLNSDTAEYQFPADDALNNINVRTYTTKDGKRGSIQSLHGNEVMADLTAYGNLTYIGGYEDIPNNRELLFYYNDNGRHLVVSYSPPAQVKVILDNNDFDKSGTNKGLNFSLQNFISNVGMVGNILGWVDGVNSSSNSPRRVNVNRDLKALTIHQPNYPLLNDDLITIIRRPPAYVLTTVKMVASSIGIVLVNNFVKDQAFQFAYRYVYLDGEQSVISPYSVINNYDFATADPVANPQFDMIQVSIPLSEIIPADCFEVDICVRYGNTGNFFVVHRWDINSDLTAINQHNAGTQQLQFNFFNDQTGQALDTTYASKLFDSVPNLAAAFTAAKDRFFISDYDEGYNAPDVTSLTATLVPDSISGSNAVGTWWLVQWKHNLNLHSDYVLYVPDSINHGYYYYPAYAYPDSPAGPFPTNLNLYQGQFVGTSQYSIVGFFVGYNFSGISFRDFYAISNTTILNDVFVQSFNKVELKSNSAWQLGITFYDKYLRSCGTITKDQLKISTPVWGYGLTGMYKGVQWNLSNSNPVLEIPEFAVYYSIPRTKNLRYTSFIQAIAHQVAYYSGDGTVTTYSFHFDVYKPAPAYAGIAIDISLLDNSGLGYTFQKGDIMNLYATQPNTWTGVTQPLYRLSIKAQYGTWVLCELQNIGTLGGGTPQVPTQTDFFFFEIETPYYPSLNEPYYEVGNLYPVANPGTSSRAYTTLQGMLNGDIVLLQRVKNDLGSSYVVEAMSPNDKFFLNWNTDIGRPNAVIQQPGQIGDPFGIRFSNQFIQGTQVNGLSSFDALNQVDVPSDSGAVIKLTLTSKVEAEGTVMLANCLKECLSIYLQEAQVYQSSQQGAFTQAITNVIGTINALKGGYGCLHPESVIEEGGRVYFYSIYKGCVVRYADDGLTPVSDYGMSNFLNKRSALLLALINQNSGIIYRCMASYDRLNSEYVLFIPQVNGQPNKIIADVTPNSYQFGLNSTTQTVLKPLTFYGIVITVSQPTTITITYGTQTVINQPVSGTYTMPLYFKTGLQNQALVITTSPNATGTVTFNEILLDPYEIEDYQQKTLGFNERENRWQGQYSIYPEGFLPLNNGLLSFLNGKVYLQESSPVYNNFFGQQFSSKVAKVVNDNVALVKYIEAVTVESNLTPDYLHLRTVFSNGFQVQGDMITDYIQQSTDLVGTDFNYKDGIWYSSFFKDRLTPGFNNFDEALNFGDDMQAQWGYIMLEFNSSTYLLVLNSIDIGYIESKGHYTLKK